MGLGRFYGELTVRRAETDDDFWRQEAITFSCESQLQLPPALGGGTASRAVGIRGSHLGRGWQASMVNR